MKNCNYDDLLTYYSTFRLRKNINKIYLHAPAAFDTYIFDDNRILLREFHDFLYNFY